MKMNKTKLFKQGGKERKIISIPFSDEIEYYTFLQSQYKAGYRQIIVSSEAMIELIKFFVVHEGFVLYSIEFVEDDDELNSEINSILNRMEKNPVYTTILFDKLKFVAENSSIDIQRIKMKGRVDDKIVADFYIQSNGIIGISESAYPILIDRISILIERCLFG